MLRMAIPPVNELFMDFPHRETSLARVQKNDGYLFVQGIFTEGNENALCVLTSISNVRSMSSVCSTHMKQLLEARPVVDIQSRSSYVRARAVREDDKSIIGLLRSASATEDDDEAVRTISS